MTVNLTLPANQQLAFLRDIRNQQHLEGGTKEILVAEQKRRSALQKTLCRRSSFFKLSVEGKSENAHAEFHGFSD